MKPDRPLSAACALAFLTPIAGVVLARLIGSAVGTTEAGQAMEVAPPVAVLPPLIEPRDRAGALASMPSPFRTIDESAVREVIEPGDTTKRNASVPAFALTSVMPHPKRPIAVINGRPRTIGEELSPGWTLAEIDGAGRTVVINGPQGDRIRVRMGNQAGGL